LRARKCDFLSPSVFLSQVRAFPGSISLAKGEIYSTPCGFSAKLMTKEKHCLLVDREMVLEYA